MKTERTDSVVNKHASIESTDSRRIAGCQNEKERNKEKKE